MEWAGQRDGSENSVEHPSDMGPRSEVTGNTRKDAADSIKQGLTRLPHSDTLQQFFLPAQRLYPAIIY